MPMFTEGDRVFWPGDKSATADSGVVVRVDGSIYTIYDPDSLWVKWDSDGKTMHINECELILESTRGISEEDKAILLLVSLGYTITKN